MFLNSLFRAQSGGVSVDSSKGGVSSNWLSSLEFSAKGCRDKEVRNVEGCYRARWGI